MRERVRGGDEDERASVGQALGVDRERRRVRHRGHARLTRRVVFMDEPRHTVQVPRSRLRVWGVGDGPGVVFNSRRHGEVVVVARARRRRGVEKDGNRRAPLRTHWICGER